MVTTGDSPVLTDRRNAMRSMGPGTGSSAKQSQFNDCGFSTADCGSAGGHVVRNKANPLLGQ